jgi:SAM-dependent methyltransferase
LYGSFDLVTMFWAGYCYLDSAERTEALVRNAMRWLRPGGMLYIEVLLARDLASFNESHFSRMNGFTVTPRTRDYEQWVYDDFGGRHWMTSPPLPFFLNIVTPESERDRSKARRWFHGPLDSKQAQIASNICGSLRQVRDKR